MPRVYTVTNAAASVTAAMDLITVVGAANKTLRILRRWVSQVGNTLPTAQDLEIRANLLTAFTVGTGGAVVTPARTDPGDAAASFTARAGDTTAATGTLQASWPDGFHVFNRYDEVFEAPPIVSGTTEAFVLHLQVAPSGTVVLSSGVLVEETGG